FVNDESGATAIEYGLIAALVAVAMIAGATQLGQSIDDKFSDVADTMDKVSDSAGKVDKGGD
ncbi:MAG: Flp family type IVb pilin, partial [Litorimonas sp.]